MSTRIVAVKFVVDDKEAAQANKRLESGLKQLDATFEAASDASGKMTAEMKKAVTAQMAYERRIDSTAKFVQQYWKAEQELTKVRQAGLAVTQDQIQGLERLKRSMVEQIALNSRVGATNPFGPQAQQTTKTLAEINTALDTNKQRMSALATTGNSVMGMLNNFSFKLFVITFAIRQAIETLLRAFVQVGEEVEKLRARINVLGGTAATFDQLFASAQKLGIGLQDYAGTFTRFAIAREQIGATNEELVKMTETIAILGMVGGGSTQEVASGMQQLGQAFASGRLQGDELRSVMENIPLVALKLAEALGKSVGELRKMGSTGELTNQVLVDGFKKVEAEAQRLFEQIPMTSDRAMNQMRNQWAELISQLMAAGGTNGVAGAFQEVAGYIEKITEYVKENRGEIGKLIRSLDDVAVAMAGAFGVVHLARWLVQIGLAIERTVLLRAAAVAAGTAVTATTGAFTVLNAVISPMLILVAGLAAGMYAFSQDAGAATSSAQSLAIEIENLEASWKTLTQTQLQGLQARVLNSLDEQKDKVQELQEAEDRAEAAAQRNIRNAANRAEIRERLTRALAIAREETANATTEQERLEKQAERVAKMMQELANGGAKAAGGMRQMGEAAQLTDKEIRKLSDSIADLQIEYDALIAYGSKGVDQAIVANKMLQLLKPTDNKEFDEMRKEQALAISQQYALQLAVKAIRDKEAAEERLAKATGRRTAATKSGTAALEKETNAIEALVKQYLPAEGAALDYAEAEKKVADALAKRSITQEQATLILSRAREDLFERAKKAEEEFTKVAETESDGWAELWKNSLERVDDAFASLWKDLLDGTSNAMEALTDLVKTTIAEIAHQLLTKPLVVGISTAFLGGTGQAVAGAAGSTAGGTLQAASGVSNMLGFDPTFGLGRMAGSALTTGLGYAGTMSASLFGGAGVSQAAMLAAQTAEFGLAGAAATGTALGSSGLTASIAAAAPILIPLAIAAAATFFMRDKTDPRAQFIATVPGGAGFEDNVSSRSTVLGLDFGLGGKSHKVDAEEYKEVFDAMAGIADAIGNLLGPEVANQIRDRVASINDQMKGVGLALDGWSVEASFKHIFTSVLDFGAETGDMLAGLLQERVGELSGTMEEMSEQIIKAITELALLPTAIKQFELLGYSLGETEEQSYRAALAIADLAGGMEALMALNEFYYQNFFTEEERRLKAIEINTTALTDWSATLGLTGEAVIDTKEEFRDYIESLDLTSEAGQEAYAAALKMMGSVVALTGALDAADDAAEGAADATEALESNLDTLTGSLRDSIASIIEMQQSITETLGNTSENIMLRMMDDEKKYDYYKGQIDAEVARLPGLTNPAEIEASINRINSLSQAASGLLDTEQLLNGMGQEWVDFLSEVQGIAIGRLEDIKRQQEDSLTKLEAGSQKIYDAGTQLAESGTRISEASNVFLIAAGVIRDAAATMPSRIVVEVREKTSEVA